MGNTSEKAQDEETRKTMGRRKLLGLAATAAAGLAATQLTEKAHADTGEPLVIGEYNEATPGDSTVLETNITPPDPEEYGIGLHVINQGDPAPRTIAIRGEAPNGAGVYGRGSMDGVVGNGDICGVVGKSPGGIGVLGISPGVGVKAESGEGTALQAEGKSKFSAEVGPADSPEERGAVNVLNSFFSDEGDARTVAIQGNAPHGTAVDGRGMTGVVGGGDECGVVGKARGEGIGVAGYSESGIGVHAESVERGSARALRVVGISSFSTVGIGEVERGQDSARVDDPSVTKESHIMVTLTSDPKSEAAVSWVNRKKGEGFTVHLTRAVAKRTDFTYFIVEPV